MNKTGKNVMNFLFTMAGTIAVVWAVFGLAKVYDTEYKVDSTWKEVVGTVKSPYYTSRRRYGTLFTYDFRGKDFECQDHMGFFVEGLIVGEKFTLKVNPQKPDHVVPIGWQPVFTDDEKRGKTICNVKHVFTWGQLTIKFQYRVDDKEYTRQQYLPPDYKEMYPDLSSGGKYEVEYWLENPQRAIIHLDKPVKD